jgi:hypothetical protein
MNTKTPKIKTKKMKSINLRLTRLLITGIMLVCSLNVFSQTIPQTITFQGKLLESGAAVTGSREFHFSFVGTAWAEIHPAVQVTDGLYSVILGSITPIPVSVFNNNTSATLHISVGTNALSPDITISSSPYAFKAEKADAAATASTATTALSADNADAIGGIGVTADYPLGNQYLRFNGTDWAPANGDWQLNAPNHLLNLNEGNVYIGNLIGNGKLSVYASDQTAIAARTTGNYGLYSEMASAVDGTAPGIFTSKSAVLGYAYNGRQYQYGVAGYRNSFGEGNSAGVFGAVSNVDNPPAWGALGYEDTELGWWGGYFHGNVFMDGQLKIAGGSPGAGKVLTSDANGLASWATAGVSSQWVSSGQNIYYSPAGGSGYVGIGLDAPTAALHVKIADVSHNYHTMEVENTATSAAADNLYGIFGKINTTSNYGANAAVVGFAAGTTGGGIGVRGISAGDLGIGVYAATSSASDNTKALMAVASTDNSYAGYFLNGKSYFSGRVGFGVANPTYQVEMTGEDVTYSGTILNVENTASEMNDFSMAIQAKINTSASVNAGTAVNGISANTLGGGVGVTGRTAGISGKGIVGIASHASGVNYGIYGRTYSSSGFAGYFMGGKNYFEGKIGVGTTEPDESLVIGSPLHGSFSVPAISVGDASGGAIELVSADIRYTTQIIPLLNSTVISSSDADGFGLGNIVYNVDKIGIGIAPTQAKLHVHNGGNESTAYFLGNGTGESFATIRSENSGAAGVAASFLSFGTASTLVLENLSTGPLLQAFGEDEVDPAFSMANNGTVSIYNGEGLETIRLDPTEIGTTQGSQLSMWNSLGEATVIIDADEEGVGRVRADAAVLGGAEVQTDGTIIIKNGSDVATIKIDPSESTPSEGSQISMWNSAGNATILLDADDDGIGRISADAAVVGGSEIQTDGTIIIKNGSNIPTIKIDPSESAPGEGGQISLWNASGVASILIDGDFNNSGRGRISTNELEITGGADIAEPFLVNNVDEIEPGTVLSIDPLNAGQLKIASNSYDRCVAGIVSGASEINPGLILKQAGTKADGKHLVALTGRVYCKADASKKPIRPGDLLTTSDLPGFAMAAGDMNRAQGAILGKAMTGLENGQGLILVLVTLQ